MVQLWKSFGELVPLFLISVIAVSIGAYFVSKQKKVSFRRVMIEALFLLSVLGILFITIFPASYTSQRVLNVIPFVGMYNILFHSVDITVPIRIVGLNILLFTPFGFFLAVKSASLNKKFMGRVVLAGAMLSLFVEVIQFIFPMGRSADIDDVILNTVGAWFGALIYKVASAKLSHISVIKNRKIG
ncbi:VanZ family protein [Halobacillus sp. B29]|uniref:VanZ family protein n=1 Tax=Halobacillus sp. B29 TaxID=3457432 RepID=UPI003FCD84F1